MKEITYDKARRGHALITVLGITVLALLMLVSITGAAPFAYIPDNTLKATCLSDGDKLKLNIERFNPISYKVWGITTAGPLYNSFSSVPEDSNPDVDLHVITSDGRRVGMDYANGTYYNEIEGSETSGNLLGGGPEWIAISDGIDATAYVTISPDMKTLLLGSGSSNVEVNSALMVYDEKGEVQEFKPVSININSMNLVDQFPISSINNSIKEGDTSVTTTGGQEEKPVANFYSPEADSVLNGTSDHDLLAGDQVSFFDKSTGLPIYWYWDFGDGNTSIQKNPTHTYGKKGGYTVNLTVTNSAGNDTISRYGYVPLEAGEHPGPANLSSDVTSGNAPLTVTFHDDDGDGPSGMGPIWREWNFGDGVIQSYLIDNNASATPYATHTYEKPGKYTVTLYMDNRAGHSIITKYNYIDVTGYPAGDAPIAEFTANVTSGNAPLKVLFTDIGTGGVPTSWNWDFGDGIYSKHAECNTHVH